jgi:hypothetical protein
MNTLLTIAMLCVLPAGNYSAQEASIRQHNCQKWYIACLETATSQRGIVYDLKQCIKKR